MPENHPDNFSSEAQPLFVKERPRLSYKATYIPVDSLSASLELTPLERAEWHAAALDLAELLAQAGRDAGLNPNP